MNQKQEMNAFVKECITTALFALMKKQPFSSIRITELTRKAGVGRVSFYRNFTSKEDVISQYLVKITQEWGKQFEQDPSVGLVESLFAHFASHKDTFILIYQSGLWHLNLKMITDACGAKPEQCNRDAYLGAFVAYGLYGWANEWFQRGMPETPSEMAALAKMVKQSPESLHNTEETGTNWK